MTDHPITPPHELVDEWFDRARLHPLTPLGVTRKVAEWAAQWGYDQRGDVNEAKLQQARDHRLEACCKWLRHEYGYGEELALRLRAAFRPKPSLHEQGMRILTENGTTLDGRIELDPEDIETFHAVLERLKQLEDSND